MNITVTIQAPELAGAIQALANAMKGNLAHVQSATLGASMQQQVQQPIQHQGVPTAPPMQQQIQQPMGVPVAPPMQQQATGVPTAPPIQQQAPVQQQAHIQQPQGVPTSAPNYTMDQLAVAATQLMDAGKQQDLLGLLASFGAQSLMALPQEQYGAFATKLREMGAKI